MAQPVENEDKRSLAMMIQDRANRKAYLNAIDEKTTSLLERLERTILEMQAEWKTQLQVLSDRPSDREWLEFLCQENEKILEKILLNIRLSTGRDWIRLSTRFWEECDTSFDECLKRFESGPKTEDRLLALITERNAIRHRQVIEDLYTKDAEYLTIFTQNREYAMNMLQIFTRVYERGIS